MEEGQEGIMDNTTSPHLQSRASPGRTLFPSPPTSLPFLQSSNHSETDPSSCWSQGNIRGFSSWKAYYQHAISYQDPYHRAIAKVIVDKYLPHDPSVATFKKPQTPYELHQEQVKDTPPPFSSSLLLPPLYYSNSAPSRAALHSTTHPS